MEKISSELRKSFFLIKKPENLLNSIIFGRKPPLLPPVVLIGDTDDKVFLEESEPHVIPEIIRKIQVISLQRVKRTTPKKTLIPGI